MSTSAGPVLETDIPARLERLAWGLFHTKVVLALGITWVLDGLEVTLAGAVAGALKESPVLDMGNAEIGFANSAYLAGAVLGAIFFGWLTDRWGRKRLFTVTLGVYLVATAATAFAWDGWSFALFRFLTGAGIGGEYTAINSAIQELIPARYRGWTDLVINGSFWIGAAVGAAGSIILLEPGLLPPDMGWRAAFFIGSVLGLAILILRLWIPESPRWLITHGRAREAERVIAEIEGQTRPHYAPHEIEVPDRVRLTPRSHTPLEEVWHSLFHEHRERTFVGLSLMTAQAFFYNAIFFTYALILTDFYGIAATSVGWYLLPFAAGNFFGPVILGRFFDTVGRRPMIALTYGLSGVLLTVTGALFAADMLSATGQTFAWSVIFFFASAAASSAYLTVAETFPLEIRALAIAFFYAVGTGIGGVFAPALFGVLIDTGSRVSVFWGYLLGAALMIAVVFVILRWGVAAERRSLETVAKPLSSAQ
ncbi:Major myo-inositol transporter IolT [Methyloligella halotolerans]|uniref:Major myo-inositol transporter IolT n=1 Tax=Methyloligella halotolerans TaxID=1177755 RepID=A0A1E2S321_9HYPH|nr:MFS transporter [Methyloligella halotolerans]ODA68903.1 Major myo-inositol transporter IolT [Methyloligella halotolerans]